MKDGFTSGDLYPPISPYSTGFLNVGEGHELYWEQSGNPDGIPVVLLHGGPGAGATPTHRRFFDPHHYRIVIFDQRGAGRSHPLGTLAHNTVKDLVADIERLRTHLKIARWHVFGGSWGSTLALHYATSHPAPCLSLVLRGIFLCEQDEIDWFLYGMQTIFPETWQRFAHFIPKAERHDLLRAYYRRLTGPDEILKLEAAKSWCSYETECSTLLGRFETYATEEQRLHAISMARIESHYFLHEAAHPEDSLLKRVHAIRHIPGVIVQGRYDVVCPPKIAYRLHQAWPEADFVIVQDAGHSALEPSLRRRLVQAMDHLKHLT